MKKVLQPLLALFLLLLLQSCTKDNVPTMHVNADGSIDLLGHNSLNHTAFNFQLEQLIQAQDTLPMDLRFEADDNTLFPTIWKVKENLRSQYQKIRLLTPTKNGEWITEALQQPLTSREEQNFDHLEKRNLLSLYLGGDKQLFEDASLT